MKTAFVVVVVGGLGWTFWMLFLLRDRRGGSATRRATRERREED